MSKIIEQPVESLKPIATLEEDPCALKREGWNLVIFYKSRDTDSDENAFAKAIQRASDLEEQTGIHSFTYNGVTYYEVWVQKEEDEI